MRFGAWIAALLVSAAASIGGPASAQGEYPNKLIKVVVPYPAGGIVDTIARAVTERLSVTWSQPIVVEAKPGANSNIGTEQVALARPDGYTWLFTGPAFMANPRFYKNLSWSEKSFVGVGIAVWAPSVMVLHPSTPAKTVGEFVALAKAKPGEFNFGNPGVGSSQHLNAMVLFDQTGIRLTDVQYRGQPPLILDLLENRVHMTLSSTGLIAQHVKEGKLRALAIVGKDRSEQLPEVPTFAEAGFPAANVVPWYGFLAPAATPRPIVDKIVAGINAAVGEPETRKRLEAMGVAAARPMNADEIAKTIAADAATFAKVIADANIKLE
jgi:tripartite-type tricarboxylate transporter receptor subunit TctC